MGYENDPYMDEDREPLMDPDMPSDRELSADPADDEEEDDWRRVRSPAPVLDEGKGGKPKKRLVKKSAKESSPDRSGSPGARFSEEGLDVWLEEYEEGGSSSRNKRKASSLKEGKDGGRKERGKSMSKLEWSGGKGSKVGSKDYGRGSSDHDDREEEIKELWDTIAGGDSEVWRVATTPENDKHQYTYFANKINTFDAAPKNLLASDSRLRPDRYALEKGDMSKSGAEKSSLEEKQRAEKRHREAKGEQFSPRWFNISGEVTPTPWGDLEVYEYNGKYTEHMATVNNSDTIEEVDIKSIEFNPWQYGDPYVIRFRTLAPDSLHLNIMIESI